MPICPQCRSHFHVGAKDQCPECGYCLPQAEARLGYGVVDFPRVLDAAGVLTRDECQELMLFLEKLERKVRPVALCVYLTDRGRREELAEHAHWILNHAQINHRAFGRRDRRLAIEDSKMQMSFASQEHSDVPADDDTPAVSVAEPRRHQQVGNFWSRLVDAYYQWFYPTPPPVEKEWMLILVLDVQLGRACFSWGYRLDAYVNGEEFSALIPCAYARFRDKDILGGVKAVMRRATARLASNAVDINAMIRGDKRRSFKQQMQRAAEEARLAAEAESAALAPNPNPVVDSAQKVLVAALVCSAALSSFLWADDVPSLTPLPKPVPAIFAGSAASESSFPTWGSDDLSLQAAGQLNASSAVLFAAPGAFAPRVEVVVEPVEDAKDTKGAKKSKDAKKVEPVEEPPAPVVELRPWRKPSAALDGAHFIDEDLMLSELEASDIERQLSILNANKPYHLYLCVMDGSHGQTPEYRAAAYLPLVVEMGQQALLIQYVYGAKPAIEISGQGLSLSAEELASWQSYLNERADAYGNARDAMLVAAECAAELLQSQIQHMREGGVDDTLYLPQASLGVVGVDAEKHVEEQQQSTKDKLWSQASEWLIFVWIFSSSALCVLVYLLGRLWVRRKAQLLETPMDIRLSAEFGSGVSPSILYKERYNKKRQLSEAEEV